MRPETATLAGTIPALFNNLILVAVSLVGLIHLLIVHQLSRLQGISFVLILTFLLSLGLVLTGYGLPLLLGKIAFMVPGGVGVVETAMVALYTGLGVPASVAVVVVMAYRVISFWLPLILGFPLIMVFQKRKSNPSTPKAT